MRNTFIVYRVGIIPQIFTVCNSDDSIVFTTVPKFFLTPSVTCELSVIGQRLTEATGPDFGILYYCKIGPCTDVLNFVFAFDNMRILTTFQLFDIRRIVARTSVECEYFILCNLTEFS